MLIDARELAPGQRLAADVCIVGAGAAGITLARELRESGLRIILLEAGGAKYTKSSHTFYTGESATPAVHAPPEMYRQRRFGGSTTIWGGRCVPLDEIDFEPRDWVPDSGWPFRLDHLLPFYRRAMSYCEAGDFEFTTVSLPGSKCLVTGFDSDAVDADTIERFSPPTNFGAAYGRELVRSDKVTLVLNGACRELMMASHSSAVCHAACRSAANTKFDVVAKTFVIATGGLEATRILLASNSSRPSGIGNGGGQLGRYYMCHAEGTLGELVLSPPTRDVAWNFERTRDGVYAKRRFRVAAQEQRRRRTLNMIFRLHHAHPGDHTHGSPVLSAMYLVKRFVIPEYRRKITMVDYAAEAAVQSQASGQLAHIRNVLGDLPALFRFSTHWVRARHLSRRRIPYVAIHNARGRYPLDFNAEQVPNPESRVTLSPSRDSLGMPRLRVDWKLTEFDFSSIAESYRALKEAVEASGVGTVDFGRVGVDEAVRQAVPVGGHHIGTTRMSETPQRGVVDADCRVHDAANLFVASSSVFPTCGHANPTLTIVALAIRLADHLKARLLADVEGRLC